MVPGQSDVARQRVHGLVSVARPGRLDAGGPPLPPNWLSWFGGPAWQWDGPRRQFYMHTFLVEQPELNWRNPASRRPSSTMVRGWRARVDGFRRRLQRAPEAPRAARQPPDRGGRRRGPPEPTPTTTTSPTSRTSSSASEPWWTSTTGTDVGGRAIAWLGRGRRRADHASNISVFDWALLQAPWSADALQRCDLAARDDVRGRAPAANVPSNHDQSRHATRLADRSAGNSDTDARRARSGRPVALHYPRHAVHVLRRGDRAERRRHPDRRDHRPTPRRARSTSTSSGDRDQCRTRCHGRPRQAHRRPTPMAALG